MGALKHAAACRSVPQHAAAQEIFPWDRTSLLVTSTLSSLCNLGFCECAVLPRFVDHLAWASSCSSLLSTPVCGQLHREMALSLKN